jgi:predicted glycoside hydrolase/deacetylase ChbG (UPF0249 family)
VNESNIRLVVNADDFGMTPEISQGIIRAHREGCVTSTSVLGNCTDLAGARAALAQAPDLGVGVHLALVGGPPVSPAGEVASLLGSDGQLLSRPREFLKSWMKGTIQAAHVQIEIDNQIARIVDAGLRPDHLDTHHHMGFLPVIGQAIETAARRHRIRGIRIAVERPNMAWVTEPRRGLEAGLLSGLSWLTRRQMGALRHGPQSWGFVESGQLDEVRILEIIGRLGPGVHELICHPAEAGPPSPQEPDHARYARPQELRALTSQKVRGALAQRLITLCRWGDLF